MDWASRPPVAGANPCGLREVGKYVQGHRGEPDDEARFVQQQHLPLGSTAHDTERDAGGEQRDGRKYHDRTQSP